MQIVDEEKLKNKKLGVTYIVLSAFFFALMNLFIRLAGDGVPSLQKCFFRNLFAFFFALAVLKRNKQKFIIGKGNLKYLVFRSTAGMLGMVCNFYAIDRLAISDASMLNKLSPFAAIVFSFFILKEKASIADMLSVFIAFLGALLVIKPTANMEVVPALLGALGGIGAGLAYTFVRKLGNRGEKGMIIVAFFSGFTTLFLSVPFIMFYEPMGAKAWLFLILTGIAATGGQICITKAYRFAPAKEISVYDFSIVLFTAIMGFAFLNQIPDLLSVIGYFIIIGTAITKYYFTIIRVEKHA